MRRTLEQEIIAARPEDRTGNAAFMKRTMTAIKKAKAHETFDHVLRTTNATKKERLLMRLRKLPVSALVAIVLGLIVFAGGAVYAATQYAPLLVKVLHKSVNTRGASEYEIGNFQDCVQEGTPINVGKFELKKDAPQISDDDVRRILQARCEMQWVSKFASKQWPTYGSHAEWQDGDRIYYARADVMGEVISVSDTAVTLRLGDGTTKTMTAQSGQKLLAFGNGEQAPLNTILPGDPVFTVMRASEIHHAKQITAPEQPHEEGLVGLVKLGLPLKFYGAMQNYLTDIPECFGNKGEYCPQTGGIEIFPREGGEGAKNPELVMNDKNEGREISGIVTKLESDAMTLKSRTGNDFTIKTPAHALADYNQKYVENYSGDSTLKIGSTVQVTYSQTPGSNAREITPSQIMTIFLQIDMLSPKQDAIKQY